MSVSLSKPAPTWLHLKQQENTPITGSLLARFFLARAPEASPTQGDSLTFGRTTNGAPRYPSDARHKRGGNALKRVHDLTPPKARAKTTPQGTSTNTTLGLCETLSMLHNEQTLWQAQTQPLANPFAGKTTSEMKDMLGAAGFEAMPGRPKNFVHRAERMAIHIHDAIPPQERHETVEGPHVDFWFYPKYLNKQLQRGLRSSEFWQFRRLPGRIRLPIAPEHADDAGMQKRFAVLA